MPGMPQWPCPLRSPRDAVCASGSAVARRTGGRFNGLGRSVERRVPVTGRHPSCHAGAHTSADPGAPARCPPGSRWREACRCRHGCAAMAIPPHRNRCPAPASHLAARQWRPVFMGAAWVAVCGMRLASVAWPAVPRRAPFRFNFPQPAANPAWARAVVLALGRFHFHDAHDVDMAGAEPPHRGAPVLAAGVEPIRALWAGGRPVLASSRAGMLPHGRGARRAEPARTRASACDARHMAWMLSQERTHRWMHPSAAVVP